MRALLLMMGALALVGCKHEPAVKDEPVTRREASPIRPGEFILGTFEVLNVDAVLELALVEGYRFEYVAAATEKTHLLKAAWADGTFLTEDETRGLKEKLIETRKFKYVELNSVQQPR